MAARSTEKLKNEAGESNDAKDAPDTAYTMPSEVKAVRKKLSEKQKTLILINNALKPSQLVQKIVPLSQRHESPQVTKRVEPIPINPMFQGSRSSSMT